VGTAIDAIACSDRVLEKLWEKKRVFTIGQGIAATADGPSTGGGRGGGESRFSTSPVTTRTPELTVKPEASPTLKEAVSELTEPFKMALPSFAHHLCVLEDCGFVHSKKQGRVRTFTLAPQPLKAAEH
jgi:DNA-binding transcriptional ArsR family regulator